MAQLVLPNTITAGTPINAAPLQANYVAIRDLINGQIEGGHSGDTARNLALNTVRVQNQHQTLRYYNATGRELQDGVVNAGDGKVTPGAGLVLNYAAGTSWVTDSGGVIGSGAARTPVSWSGGSVSIAANASGNPRIDQVIATITDVDSATISVLQGTATAAATLDNRTGAAALPASAVRLADILMPTGFAGPFVQATHIRDRRPWARGACASIVDTTTGAVVVSSTSYGVGFTLPAGVSNRIEVSGNPVMITAIAQFTGAGASTHNTGMAFLVDGASGGAVNSGSGYTREVFATTPAASTAFVLSASWLLTAAELPAGSHTLNPGVAVTSSNSTLARDTQHPFGLYVQELVSQFSANDGA